MRSSNSCSWEKYTKINGKTKLAGGSKYHCFSLPLEFCVFKFMKIQANFENYVKDMNNFFRIPS